MCFVIAALENQQEVETRGAGKELHSKSDRSLGWPEGQSKAGARSGKRRKRLSKGEATYWMGGAGIHRYAEHSWVGERCRKSRAAGLSTMAGEREPCVTQTEGRGLSTEDW